MGVYTRIELLQYQDNKTCNDRLPQDVWNTIWSLGIERDEFRPTRRGVKSGLKVKQKRTHYDKHTFSTQSSTASKNNTNLNVCQWNARSIRNKTTTCSDLVMDHKLDIMFLTETWLSADLDQVAIGELTLPGYNFINMPRKTDRHGGIGILHRSALKLQIHPSDFLAETFEHVIIIDKESKIKYVIVYRPPPSSENKFTTSKFLSEFDDFLMFVNTLSGKIIFLGDFNVHVNKPERADVAHYLSSLEGIGFHQHVVGPTHISGNTLDHVMSRTDENLVLQCTVGTRLSDHNVIHCKLNVEKPSDQKEIISARKVKDIDSVSFESDFHSALISSNNTPDDANAAVEMFEKAVTLTLDKHAPATERTCNRRVRQPWYGKEIHEARRVRRKLEKKWRRTGRLEVHHQLYLDQHKLVNTMIESAKKAYFRDKLKNADSKSAFRTINGLLNNNNKTLPTHDSLQCLCDDFAFYFKDKVDKIQKGLEVERSSVNSNSIIDSCNQSNVVYELSEFPLLSENDMSKLIQGFSAKNCLLDCIPTWFIKSNLTAFVPIITKIANMSLSTGVFPAALKHAIISPIIKKPSLDPNNLKNYRPVSNIKFLSKVIEKHAVNTISNHMRECNLGEPLQSAYRTAHSTETALLKVKMTS
ncbi:uncharacterized protein [Amphiura filiformis]|uniref:uncharacterized protein n=1 Tax=Amphiura filiformis TaxID=82378 RepID=UPI003B226E23